MSRGPISTAVLVTMLALVAGACGGDDADERIFRVAFLRAVPATASTEPAFLAELRQSGYEQGRNLEVIAGEGTIAYPDPAEAEEIAADWQRRGVDVILALSTSGADAARRGAPDTNVVFLSNDPTAAGLVDDERAPSGRLTGVTFRVPADRTIDLARRIVPGLTTIGLAHPADDPAALANRDVLAEAAANADMALVAVPFTDAGELAAVVGDVKAGGAQLLMISTSPTASRLLEETAEAAAASGLPMVSNTPLAQRAIMSLSPDTDELGRQLARQVARLFGGSRPGAIPVEDPRRFVLTLNEAAATEAGISLPPEVVREANEVTR